MKVASSELSHKGAATEQPRSKIGYGQPPESTRFKKGVSGNPGGRPKRSKSLASLVLKHLQTMVTVRQNGQERRMTKLEAGLIHMSRRFATGEPAVFNEIRRMLDRPEAQTVEVRLPLDVGNLPEDRLTLAASEYMDRQFDRLFLGKDLSHKAKQ